MSLSDALGELSREFVYKVNQQSNNSWSSRARLVRPIRAQSLLRIDRTRCANTFGAREIAPDSGVPMRSLVGSGPYLPVLRRIAAIDQESGQARPNVSITVNNLE